MIVHLASVTCTGHKMDRTLIKKRHKPAVMNSEHKESEEALNQLDINMKMPKRGRTDQLQVFRVENETHSRWEQELSREMNRWILISYPWHDPSVLNMQTNLFLFQTKQISARISKQNIQNSMKVICLAANSEWEKQHSLLLHFVSSKILLTGQPLLQSV